GFAYADGTLLAHAGPNGSIDTTQTWKKFIGLGLSVIGGLGMFFCSGLQRIHESVWVHDVAHALRLDNLPYPTSMVGLPNENLSNMNPPTMAIMFLAITQIGLVIVFRDRLQKILQGRRIWTFTVAI